MHDPGLPVNVPPLERRPLARPQPGEGGEHRQGAGGGQQLGGYGVEFVQAEHLHLGPLGRRVGHGHRWVLVEQLGPHGVVQQLAQRLVNAVA
ncbi:MAG TPA: hypothetical protein VGQ26_11685 [Streptosporangiaceae bacterium]|nr:hypothetical protein [Streptosporangiaceae bacterium]